MFGRWALPAFQWAILIPLFCLLPLIALLILFLIFLESQETAPLLPLLHVEDQGLVADGESLAACLEDGYAGLLTGARCEKVVAQDCGENGGQGIADGGDVCQATCQVVDEGEHGPGQDGCNVGGAAVEPGSW